MTIWPLAALILECFLPLAALCLVLALRFGELTPLRLLKAVFTGLLALLPIAALQILFPRNIPYLLRLLLLNGIIEEGIKMLVLFLLTDKKTSLKIFFLQALIAGFALGSFESIVYALNGQQNIMLRMLTAAPAHAMCAGLSAFFVFSRRGGRHFYAPFIGAVILHTVYNFFAGFTGVLWWFSLASPALAAALCAQFYEKLKNTATGG